MRKVVSCCVPEESQHVEDVRTPGTLESVAPTYEANFPLEIEAAMDPSKEEVREREQPSDRTFGEAGMHMAPMPEEELQGKVNGTGGVPILRGEQECEQQLHGIVNKENDENDVLGKEEDCKREQDMGNKKNNENDILGKEDDRTREHDMGNKQNNENDVRGKGEDPKHEQTPAGHVQSWFEFWKNILSVVAFLVGLFFIMMRILGLFVVMLLSGAILVALCIVGCLVACDGKTVEQAKGLGNNQSAQVCDNCAEGSSSDFRWFFSALLFRSAEPDDEACIGWRGTKSDEIPKGMPERTIKGLWSLIRRLPKHFVEETHLSLVPLLVCCVIMFLHGYVGQVVLESVPGHNVSLKALEWRTPEMDHAGMKLLTSFPGFFFNVVLVLANLFYVRPMWKKDTVYWWMLTWGLLLAIQYILFATRPFMASIVGGRMIDLINFSIAQLVYFTCGFTFAYKVGRANKNPFLLQSALISEVAFLCVYSVYRQNIPRMIALSDPMKIAIVGLVNPLALQVFQVTTLRMVARAFHHNDPSTSWCYVAKGLVWEKAYSRILIATMDSAAMVSVASLASAAGAGLVLTALGDEDLRAYRLLGACVGKKKEALHNRNHHRNAAFRTSCYVFAFTLDMAMIVCFAVWPHAYNMSRNGKAPDWGVTLAKMFMQILFKYATTAAQIVLVTFWQGVDFLTHAKNRCPHWEFLASLFCALPVSMMCVSGLPPMICGAPESATSFKLC